MRLTDAQLKGLLLKAGVVSKEDLDKAEKEAQIKKETLEEYLTDSELISTANLGQLLATYLGFSYANLREEKIDPEILEMVPEIMARAKGVVAFAVNKEGIKVGMTDPSDLEIQNFLEKRLGQKILPFFITKGDLEEALYRYRPDLKSEFEELMKKVTARSTARASRDEMIVKSVDLLLQYGYDNKASDIHIEPADKKVTVRFRIDGIMHEVLELPKDIAELVLTRIKILARMRTDEHRSAQDGKLRYNAERETIDVRVSVLPVTQGENVVMRLLSARSRQFSLTDLGLIGDDFKKLKVAMKHPHGMILVTGPTGSGKTTTLYAVLKILNKREVNIATVEDPVEYDIEGVSQIQVNPKTNLTFAEGLRAILRQDPDIIMVGEIRDKETAGIAVNSALTGHLVLSTLHTNDAVTTLPRLLDMGVEPFLVASTVNIAIAQRLVRKICPKCRYSYHITPEEKTMFDGSATVKALCQNKRCKTLDKIRLYKGSGCKACNGTGYSGRIGIFEVLEMTEEVRDLISRKASVDEVQKLARSQGMSTMMEDGIEKVFNGVTTLDEVMRVTME